MSQIIWWLVGWLLILNVILAFYYCLSALCAFLLIDLCIFLVVENATTSPNLQVYILLQGFMVNSYFCQLVLSQLVLFHWSTRTFLELVLWSTPTFSLVSSYFSLVNSYFFFSQLVLFEKICTICFVTLLWHFLCLKP